MAKYRDPSDDDTIFADWDTGEYSSKYGGLKTQRDLAHKHRVSVAKINKMVKGREPRMNKIVNDLVNAKQTLAKQNDQTVNAVNKAVEDQTKNLDFYNNGQNFLAKVSLAKVKGTLDPKTGQPTENTTPQLLAAVSGVVSTSRQGVIGSNPSTIINNTNAQQNNDTSSLLRELAERLPV